MNKGRYVPLAAAMASLLLGGCAAPINPSIPAALQRPAATTASARDDARDGMPRETRVAPAPGVPLNAGAQRAAATGVVPAAPTADGEVLAAINLQQVALPTFVQILYAEVLKKPVNLHASVTTRPDLVTFRTPGGQSAAQIEQAVRLLLKGYGLSVIEVGGLVRVVPDNASSGDLPGIRYGAALPDVPATLRPVFHLVQLEAVRQTDVTNWLRTMFGERVKVQEDAGRNAVLISGNPDNIKAALEAIATLDQPAMKGRASLALTPAFWSADELARRLAEVLGAEGYAVHPIGQPFTPGAARNPVILLPVPTLNSVYVFAASDTVLTHVADWARTLDKPSERGIGKNFFSYAVRHKDAEALAETLDRILSGSRGSAAAAAAAAAAPAANAGGAAQPATATRYTSVVVDKSTNTLIFQSSQDEYGQIISLLRSLDRPTKSALIEVTVAELSLDDSRSFGVEWLTNRVESDRSYQIGTVGGEALGTAGLNLKVFNGVGALRVALNALASDNRATILSSPRLMARNGESATIQVGSEVPIITSQQATNTVPGSGNGVGLLQTVQYRTTGVILKIKPVIHSGDQVDLDVVQEVSEAAATKNGVTSTPTFLTRKVDTKLTLRSGATALLGGLISESGTSGNAGVPFLKDIPVVGGLFSKQSKGGVRRELIILITPYIANDSHDTDTLTDAFRKSLGSWATGVKPVDRSADKALDAPAGDKPQSGPTGN